MWRTKNALVSPAGVGFISKCLELDSANTMVGADLTDQHAIERRSPPLARVIATICIGKDRLPPTHCRERRCDDTALKSRKARRISGRHARTHIRIKVLSQPHSFTLRVLAGRRCISSMSTVGCRLAHLQNVMMPTMPSQFVLRGNWWTEMTAACSPMRYGV